MPRRSRYPEPSGMAEPGQSQWIVSRLPEVILTAESTLELACNAVQEIPPSILSRYQRCGVMLTATISQSRSVRSRWMMVAAAAALVAVGIVTYIVIGNQTAAGMVTELQQLEKTRQVAAARKMMDGFNTTHVSYLARTDIAKAMTDSTAFVKREESLRTAFDEAATAFETQLRPPNGAPGTAAPKEGAAPEPLTDAQAATLQMLADRASAARDALAEDFRPDATSRLSSMLNLWQKMLDASLQERVARFRTTLDQLEKQAQSELSMTRPMEELEPAALSFSAKLAQLTTLDQGPIPALKMPGDLTTRLRTLRESKSPY